MLFLRICALQVASIIFHHALVAYGASDCGCGSGCTSSILSKNADGATVSSRIDWVIANQAASEEDACRLVCGSEFPDICGECNPDTCGPCSCGSQCSSSILSQDADGYSVQGRINWLINNQGTSEDDACRRVCGTEFNDICGECDPDSCSTGSGSSSSNSNNNGGSSNSGGSVCGGCVNAGRYNCQADLWNPVGDSTMPCYAYGGPSDPCALHNNNDYDNNGLNKNPSACTSDLADTFYLWDEPDTQGLSYTWAGSAWAGYANTFSAEIAAMRNDGIKFTSPMITAGESGAIKGRVDAFYAACGSGCSDPTSAAYIDIIAVNAFCGPWNTDNAATDEDGCRGGAWFIVDEVNKLTSGAGGNLPVYITNWSRLRTATAADQVAAISATDGFFKDGSPVERVYWFGAQDYGGGSTTNYLTDSVTSGPLAGRTLGSIWKAKCDVMDATFLTESAFEIVATSEGDETSGVSSQSWNMVVSALVAVLSIAVQGN